MSSTQSMTIDQKALEAGMVWFARNFNGAPDSRELCSGIITAYLAALPASDHAGLVEEGVEVMRRLSVAKLSLSDADFISGWVLKARQALREAATALSAGVRVKITEKARIAFYEATEITREGSVRNLDAGLTAAISALSDAPVVTEEATRPVRAEIKSEREILERLAAGDKIAFSQDGDDAFFVGGDRAFVGAVIINMRSKGYLKRIVLDEENYRGMAEHDVISDAGRAALEASE